ncbi:N-acetylglucosaminyl-phosphatidylinositol biosynthetic protein gpi1 [Ceratocystis fimbriata CBS 114723]|uniref:N-acetylglucosaminyl-phosphatidylinositol biosynthetic protein gpi1 n=1 Tax=Ceratocystis fimbriata CBS 114723 TaxID=1035309 RepID=A0A2C5X2V1_9PEZI|nr:N-acetylglucosaminyl-phosphatidylinositol biosynthetic protein gpi1 [Ceratocystis fimbriata CBS 114723]
MPSPIRDGLMRIFWPADIPRSSFPGVIVGWKNSERDMFVVAILDVPDPRAVESHFRSNSLFRYAPHSVSRLFELCGRNSMRTLGLANQPQPSTLTDSDPSWIYAAINPNVRVPRIQCPTVSSIQIILFDRPIPSKMQYISLKPISLALADKNAIDHAAEDENEDEDDKQEHILRAQKKRLIQRMKDHTITMRTRTAKETALPLIVNQINCSWELETLLQKNASMIGTRPKRSLSISERMAESATSAKNILLSCLCDIVLKYILPVIRQVFVLFIMGHRIAAEMLLQFLEFRARPGYAALKDLSATAQQVEIRLQQFCYWPTQNTMLRQRKQDWASVTTSHPDYIRFFNSLWLVANDVIIGMAIGSYIIEHCERVANQISHLLDMYTVLALQRSISWLMGWPAGLKLNNELAAFLGDLFLWVIDYWASCINMLHPVLPHIIWFIGFSSFAGASMPIAMFSDLLSGLTIHIYSFYLASARIFNWQLTILMSLFHLFRGKKHNVLRDRIDSCDYDLDQLLVGTILFTLLFFLLPTVVVFYLNFAVARMVIISLKAVFDSLLSCLNHFPLFAIMLRIKDPKRLPGGIRFELHDIEDYYPDEAAESDDDKTHDIPPTSIIYLQPIPLSFKDMFQQYSHMAQRIRKHYLSLRVLLCLLTGRFVPPIDRKNLYSLQYSMLPAQRAGIWDIWQSLNAPLAQPLHSKNGGYVEDEPLPFFVNMDLELDNDQFYKHFQTTIAGLEERIAGVSTAQTAEQRNQNADAIRAGISQLTRELADASVRLPRYDQRNYNEALKTVTAKVNAATEKAAPKPRFQFRRSAVPSRPNGPCATDTRKLTTTHASASTQRLESQSQSQSQLLPQTQDSSPNDIGHGRENGVVSSEKDYNCEIKAQKSRVRRPSFSSVKEVSLAHHLNVRISLPETAAVATAAGRLTDVVGCVVDMSGATRSGSPFAGFAIKNINSSLVISGTVAGPVHITAVRDSVLVIVARQIRIHECHNVDIYLHCGSRPIIEDCSGLKFAPVTEYYAPGDLLGANQWNQVDDFKWPRANASPNWSVLPKEKAIEDDVWKDIEADSSSEPAALLDRVKSW